MNIKNMFVKSAIKVAEKSSFYPFRVGCVITNKNRIISYGVNRVGSCSRIDPNYQFRTFSIHAEADALSKIKKDKAKGSSLYIVRINVSDAISNAKPCIYCQKMLYDYGIKDVFCSDKNGNFVQYKVKNLNKKFITRDDEIGYYDLFLEKI